ncbi:protein kinase C and casein kinase substrate in neurons protein 2-like [Tropilaelaps mercedesae]|uniref:Protein kinase C and casein kinase substrate in neurons protein 2-like n=1 Tax=Tropilaelaps mercedesae TaxID=418985 RepID=A0A1V9XSU8_9ACAR|nr:protein kinase C and casein kinase substrate in neurons protein 2-like [Tropilaelaps mercedesae]
MSQHSDDVVASTDSFWEPGNYKRTTKRIEDGNRLCNDLIQLVTERAEMEKNYAKGLRAWAKKWNDLIEKGPEYVGCDPTDCSTRPSKLTGPCTSRLLNLTRSCDFVTALSSDRGLNPPAASESS